MCVCVGGGHRLYRTEQVVLDCRMEAEHIWQSLQEGWWKLHTQYPSAEDIGVP